MCRDTSEGAPVLSSVPEASVFYYRPPWAVLTGKYILLPLTRFLVVLFECYSHICACLPLRLLYVFWD